ncbi:uncharacterized protein [Miscanthus floridulus]|uniref:uncharacterized protein isoform X3 n=2 Tax=Miscanthus floridulus TaxID=154761 RepID=UPI003458E70E
MPGCGIATSWLHTSRMPSLPYSDGVLRSVRCLTTQEGLFLRAYNNGMRFLYNKKLPSSLGRPSAPAPQNRGAKGYRFPWLVSIGQCQEKPQSCHLGLEKIHAPAFGKQDDCGGFPTVGDVGLIGTRSATLVSR